jgi:hypothetical protein
MLHLPVFCGLGQGVRVERNLKGISSQNCKVGSDGANGQELGGSGRVTWSTFEWGTVKNRVS